MRTKNKLPRILNIAIFTLITTLIWIVFGIWRIIVTKPNVDIPPAILEPLNPNLDTDTLNSLKTKIVPIATTIPMPQSTIISTASPLPTNQPVP